jgi:hypothetical protein
MTEVTGKCKYDLYNGMGNRIEQTSISITKSRKPKVGDRVLVEAVIADMSDDGGEIAFLALRSFWNEPKHVVYIFPSPEPKKKLKGEI